MDKMTNNLFIFFLILLCRRTYSELYTALVELEELLQTESILITTINHFIQAEEQKLSLLKKYSQDYQKQHAIAAADVQSYVANPINAYLLVKRLTADWKQVENLMNTNLGQDFVANLSQHRELLKFPSEEDLRGAAVALTRLQDTYRLDTSSLARGEINGVKYSSELSASDCFELGAQSYDVGQYNHSYLWMMEADARLGREQNETAAKSDILEYLAISAYMLGNTVLALQLTNKLLELIPTYQTAIDNKLYYEQEIANVTAKRDGNGVGHVQQTVEVNEYILKLQLYEQLCKGDVTTPPEMLSKMRCRYMDNGNFFLKIAPFKVEEAYHEPRILIFHDVMSDDEISTIKQMARPRFQRAGVTNRKTGDVDFENSRISKSAWLQDQEHKHIADVAQRVEDMTGLTMESSEALQVVNYGIGGHYIPHYDFTRSGDALPFKDLSIGNRIATVLFYMSDVALGGATVFPNIQVALWPKKGTAAFWYNLHSSGEGDARTLHAACPVLIGSKWVSNKWIHEHRQEFRRPCDLTRPPFELTA